MYGRRVGLGGIPAVRRNRMHRNPTPRSTVGAGPEVAELANGMRVEGARHDFGLTEGGHAIDHLVGSLVGEGDEQDLGDRHDASLEGVGGATTDDARLARSGAGRR